MAWAALDHHRPDPGDPVFAGIDYHQRHLQTLTYAVTSVPGADRTKVRGEERFSVFSLARLSGDPRSQLASQFIQIWPVADGSITGITQGQIIRMAMPQLTLTLNDLYPSSTTYAQVYKGSPAVRSTGTVVPGSNLVVNDTIPCQPCPGREQL